MAFSLRAGTHWCHDFPKLARESGFYFNAHGNPVRIDWNRISTIDIDRLMRDRDFLTIDENVNNVVDYTLESTYDIKILDSNFVKIFRLAQLSVEYLLYCRQYLDQSVIILKDDLKSKLEENQKLKRELSAAEEHIKELKEKSKEKYRWLEKKLSDSTGEIHKCPHCPKTFISSIFMTSHITRRHSHLCLPSPGHDEYRAEAEKLHNEIKTLKERLNETERIIRSESKLHDTISSPRFLQKIDSNENEKIEEDYDKYRQEMANLGKILFSEMQNFENIEKKNYDKNSEKNDVMKQQEDEIKRLRDQLETQLTLQNQSKLNTQENHFWQLKIQEIENQHRIDIDKLNQQLMINQETTEKIKSDYTNKIIELEEKSKNYIDNLVYKESREINISQGHCKNYEKKILIEENSSDIEITTPDFDNPINDKSEFELKKKCHQFSNSQDDFLKQKESIEVKEIDYKENFERFEGSLRGPDRNSEIKIHSLEIKSQNKMNEDEFHSKEKSPSSSEDINSESPVESQTSDETKSSEEGSTIIEDIKDDSKGIEEIKTDINQDFDQRLRGLGIDPEWRTIPYPTYKQLIATMGHHRSLCAKKYRNFKGVRQHILSQLSRRISKSEMSKFTENTSTKSPLNKLMSNVTSKAIKGLKILKTKDRKTEEKFSFRGKPSMMKLRDDIFRKYENPKERQEIENSMFSPSKSIRSNRYVSSPKNIHVTPLFHSYESIKEFVNNSPSHQTSHAVLLSTPQKSQLSQDYLKNSGSEQIVSLSGSPINNKSLLKGVTGSVGSLVKKKVLFDLDKEISEDDSPSSQGPDDEKIPSFDDEQVFKLLEPASEPLNISKLSQSEKIKEIAKKLDEKLSLSRRKPIGGVSVYNNEMFDEILGKPEGPKDSHLTSLEIKERITIPRPATRLSSSLNSLPSKSASNESNLDLDIEELLRLD